MNNGGDAAEQVVRLSLEGFEVAARLTGSAAKNVAVLLMAALKEEGKTRGKARLTNMIRSGKELKVFAVPQKDLQKFTGQAKKYGVLYCILRDKDSKNPNAPVDIIARADDASKIQRIVDRFEIGTIDKAEIVSGAQENVKNRKGKEAAKSAKTKGQQIVEEALGAEKTVMQNPLKAKTQSPPSRQNSESAILPIDQGEGRPSVKAKLSSFKEQLEEQNEIWEEPSKTLVTDKTNAVIDPPTEEEIKAFENAAQNWKYDQSKSYPETFEDLMREMNHSEERMLSHSNAKPKESEKVQHKVPEPVQPKQNRQTLHKQPAKRSKYKSLDRTKGR